MNEELFYKIGKLQDTLYNTKIEFLKEIAEIGELVDIELHCDSVTQRKVFKGVKISKSNVCDYFQYENENSIIGIDPLKVIIGWSENGRILITL